MINQFVPLLVKIKSLDELKKLSEIDFHIKIEGLTYLQAMEDYMPEDRIIKLTFEYEDYINYDKFNATWNYDTTDEGSYYYFNYAMISDIIEGTEYFV